VTGLVLLLLLVALGVGGALWMTLPSAHETARIEGLSAPVNITLDADGIPRIRAANLTDAAAALGFLHARDRLFQMEMMRRNASGRLSEVAGRATLRVDRLMRVLGLRRAAEAELQGLDPATRAVLDAYSRGVNAYIAAHGRFTSPEFLALGTPAPWTPVDSLLWGKMLGLWLSENWDTEIARLRLAGKLTPEQISELRPNMGTDVGAAASIDPPKLPGGDALARRLADALPAFPAPFTLPDSASNEWAVDGRHTATGKPLLAGDPHLGFSLPGIWYLARIDTPNETLAGATSPGVPFLVIGHNRHIAWTFTTTGADVQDVFIETPTADGHGYLTPDGPRPFMTRTERIRVRGEPDEMLTVRSTRHGPVVSDLGLGDGPRGPVLAVEMANLAPGDTSANGLFALNRATNRDDARRAAAMISAPVQNLLVADADGIALDLTGRVPIRRAGDGSAPVMGADGAHDWIGFASGDALPHFSDPPSGRLVNANERVAPPGDGAYLGRDYYGDWRARRIREMLDATPRATAADFARMQTDVISDYARQILPALRQTKPEDAASAAALRLFDGWDDGFGITAPQPLLFDAWMPRFRDAVLARAGIAPSWAVASLEFTAFVLSPAGASWCGGNCGPILSQTLAATAADLTARFGADPGTWRWGAAHPAIFAHPLLGHLPLIGALATATIPAPGDSGTVDAGGNGWTGRLPATHGPSYRGVYDLADLDRSLFVVTPGQSGNLLDAHATDFLRRWRDGDTVMLGPVAKTVEATVRLVP
jgi:penicillin amidase